MNFDLRARSRVLRHGMWGKWIIEENQVNANQSFIIVESPRSS